MASGRCLCGAVRYEVRGPLRDDVQLCHGQECWRWNGHVSAYTDAANADLVLLTKNHDDFEDLHLLVQATSAQHLFLLVVRLDNDPNRDMKDRGIVRAIVNLEQAGVPVANGFHILNHWR